jgi:multicomponent Na+:H+ antiporter subunit B
MNRPVRRVVFFVGAVLLAWTFFLAYSPLPPVGAVTSRYGDLVNAITVPERHITDAVTAVNFDIRGFDTLGEEFILFTSVIGTVLLMRRQSDESRGDHEDHVAGRRIPPVSDAIRITSLALVPATVAFGLYVVTHGQVTPGGGFQGGVILSSAPILIYLCSNYTQFRRAVQQRVVEAAEAFGTASYILVGGVGVAMGGLFLQNTLPLGPSGTITAGGTVALIDLGVGLAVSGGLCLALLVYLEELVERKEQ